MAEIGIKLADGAFYPVLPDESQQRKRLVLGAAQPSEGSVHIDLLRRDGDEETYIGSLAVQDLDPTQDVEFELRMEIDANGDLDVFVHDSGRTQYQSLSIPLRDLENPTVSSPFGDDDADDEGFSQFFPEETLEDSSDFESESEADPEPEPDDSDISDFDLDQELLDDDEPPEAEETPIDIDEITLNENEPELGESFDEYVTDSRESESSPDDDFDLDDAPSTSADETMEDDEIDVDSFVLGGDLDADFDSGAPSDLDDGVEPAEETFESDDGLENEFADELDEGDFPFTDDDLQTEPSEGEPDADTYTDTYSLDAVEKVGDTDTMDVEDEPPAPAKREKRKKDKAPKNPKAESKAASRSYANTPASHHPVNPVVMAALILVVVSLLALGAWLVLLLQNAQVMPELRASYIIPMVCFPHRRKRRSTR